jgi:hypothetical protein
MATKRYTEKQFRELRDGIFAAVRAAVPVRDAARAAGVSRATFNRWIQEGTALNEDPPKKATKYQAHVMAFADGYQEARAEAHQTAVRALWELATGGDEETTVVRVIERDEKNKAKVIEEKITTRKVGRSVKALELILTRQWPDDWGQRELPPAADQDSLPAEDFVFTPEMQNAAAALRSGLAAQRARGGSE